MSVFFPRPAVLDRIRGTGAKPPRHVVIEASAGTGKTFALEHAVLDLLLAGKVPIEKLLVVTFTERATYELRERIRALLARILAAREVPGAPPPSSSWKIDAAARGAVERALADFDRAPFLTIHGFCQRVLVENAFAARRLFRQELVPSRVAFSSGFKHVLRRRLATDPVSKGDLAAWAEERSVEDLEKLLYQVSAKRADVRPSLDREALASSVERLHAARRRGLFGQARAAVSDSTLFAQTRTAVLERLDGLERFLDSPASKGSLVGLCASRDLGDAIGYLLDAKRRTAIEKNGAKLGKLLGLLDLIRTKLVTFEAAAAQVFLPPVRDRVALEKEASGRYDFDDMIALVGRALREGPCAGLLRERLRERYAHALLDEFQDTDEVQWGIFRSIFVDGPGEHGLWVIGDPKQSIYGFRGADVLAYLRARDALLAGSEPVRLVESFRATKELIAAQNAIFDQRATPPFFRGEIRYDAPVECGRPDLACRSASGERVSPVHVYDLVSPDRALRADQVRDLLGRRMAREIRRILDEGLDLVSTEGTRRVGPGDIHVLTRSARDGETIGRLLAEQGVPFAFYRKDGIFQTAEAEDVHRALVATSDPRDRSKRHRAWTTAFFGLALDDLARGDPPPEHPLFQRLLAWERLAQRQDFRALFASMVEESGLLRREIFLESSERRLTNYLHVLEVLLETVGRARLDVRDLAALLRSWIDEDRAPEGEDGNVQRLESDARAVQVSTLHKSKGLQATVVFLYGGFTDPKARELNLYHEPGETPPRQDQLQTVVYHDPDGKRVVHVGPLSQEVARLVANETAEEERRLLYVGCTRARGRLYLASFGKHAKVDRNGNEVRNERGERALEWDFPMLGGCYVHLAERLHALLRRGERPAGFTVEVVSPDDAPSPGPSAATPAAPWAPPDELLVLQESKAVERELAALREKNAPLIVTSYTRMKAGSFALSAAEIEADVLQEETVLPGEAASPEEGEEEPRGGARTGIFFHEVLERLPFETFDGSPAFEAWREVPEVAALFAKTTERHAIPAKHRLACERMVFRTLTARLLLGGAALDRGLASCRRNLRELEFAYPIPESASLDLPKDAPFRVERGYVKGFIDFIFEHEGRAYLLDWKTDTLDDYSPASLARRVEESYGIQLRVYTLALARMLGASSEAEHESRFGGVLYVFLRGARGEAPNAGVHFERPGFARIREFERELAGEEYR